MKNKIVIRVHSCSFVATRFCLSVLLALSLAASVWADQREQPVGLVLSPGGSKLRRADAATPLAARSGDLLFSGDILNTETASASFLFCPEKAIETMAPSSEVHMEAGKPKVKVGKLSPQPARTCSLPQTLRVAVASQQHYGVTMTRGGLDPLATPPVPRDRLPADVLAELSAVDAAYATSDDPAIRIAAASVFEKHDLTANALEIYYKLREQWPDAVWVKGKIFDLEQALAARAAIAAATTAAQAGGQTYALMIGISKYKRPELALQFAHADAIDFSRLLQSPRAGGLNPNNVVLLTDEKATTAAVRNAFQDLLKRRAGKNDTVILMVAGHGTVELPGSGKAFILTYDSDPQDLSSTALPMSELRTLFEEQLKNVGHVLMFADVCKAANIGSIHNNTVNANVSTLGEVEGDLFGLLASGPKQVSFEGPEYGGGHGVFSYFVLKGLEGAADSNKDGAVDIGELSIYVVKEVYEATNHRQKPTEIGSSDSSLKVSDLAKPGINLASLPSLLDPRHGEPLYQASTAAPEFAPQASAAVDRFTSAMQAGRLLPTTRIMHLTRSRKSSRRFRRIDTPN